MRILEYRGLDLAGLAAPYRKVCAALAAGDFHAAQAKKLVGARGRALYRARLNDTDRLIFTLLRHGDETAVLVLETIRRHDYAGSRFLRGAEIDESALLEVEATAAAKEAQPVRYLHPMRTAMHVLDKPISFDDVQQTVFEQPAPLIVVGSAGSGKTALVLEKLKQVEGEVLYVTLSAYLAQSARDLYYAQGFEAERQEAEFLSYGEFLESLRVPAGSEATWPRFAAWFARMRQAFRGIDAHQAFEEIRGVIVAQAEDVMSRDDYRGLGVRQSIFAATQRDALYDLFEKYRAWLAEEGLYDLNLLAHERLPLAAPRYDFVVVDEVQDLTAVQLALTLKTLRKPGQFLLCGDSNQIVHPNFFAWSRVKTLFWRDAELGGQQELRVLQANFRNSAEATRLANTLLKIKHCRFGSVDRESNFLVEAVGAESGQAVLLPDKEAVLRDLDRQSRQSTQVAVLVLREEDKPAARKVFSTPLLFCVHEAKGLEYENIVLYRFVSDQRGEYAELSEGVDPNQLEGDALQYRRARDKSDKSLEVYKFFVNALYVALTRAQKNVYLVESDLAHPLFSLLRVGADESARVTARAASREDWQREAHRLQQQGKLEQAQAIRRDLLRESQPPWPIHDEAWLRQTLVRVFRERQPGNKQRQQLLEFAAVRNCRPLADALCEQLAYSSPAEFERMRPGIQSKYYGVYASRNFKEVLRNCDRYGVDHRTPFNITPLMAAAGSGNLALVDALIERGADLEQADDFGQGPLHWALRTAFGSPSFARDSLAALYERLAPSAIDLQAGQRLVRIDRHQSEYLLLQTLWCLFREQLGLVSLWQDHSNFDSSFVLDVWAHLPHSVLRPERRRRQHISALLARNEVARDYAYNRRLFRRVARGRYQFDPGLSIRVRQDDKSSWVPVLKRLNVGLGCELVPRPATAALQQLVREAGLEPLPLPVIAQALQRAERAGPAGLSSSSHVVESLLQQIATRKAQPKAAPRPPPWGTPEARRHALARLRARNEALRRGEDPPED